MATAASRRLSTGIAWGAFGVLAWATFSIFTSSSAAHAQDDSDGLLGEVSSVLSSTVGGTTDLVKDVATEVVEPVMTPVADIAADAVPAVTAPVTDLLQDAPVSKITDPVLDIVTDVPVVGGVLEGIGVTDAVDDVAGVVDSTTDLLGDTVEGTLPPVLDAVHPEAPASAAPAIPADPAIPAVPTVPSIPTPMPTPVAPATEPPVLPAATVADVVLRDAPTITVSSASTVAPMSVYDQLVATLLDTANDAGPNGAPAALSATADALAPLATAPSSAAGGGGNSGNGGNAVSDAARLADGGLDALHSWTRTLGASDDALPSSPVAEADVAPD